MKKVKKRNVQIQKDALKKSKVPISSTYPLLIITLKFVLLIIIISGGIIYSENKGYFEPDDKNNHTLKKWNSFYNFTKRNNVDVLLVGNSHLYTGINPKNLSTALGVNAFILASPGTSIADSYYALKEALKKCSPSVIIIETFGIKAFNQHEFTDNRLSDQFKSFSARRNFYTKLISTPFLFTTDNYPYAWLNTLRNHDFLYKNKEQIEKNIAKKKKRKKKNKLYLGRYVRFQKGLQYSTLQKYETLGARIEGRNYNTNYYTEYYVKKIIETCGKSNIELIFLTLPMYHKHVANYSIWKNKLSLILGDYANKNWIDMQDSAGYNDFTIQSFENTYKTNQHMTYSGSLIATYKLADYILERKSVKLPDRRRDKFWRKLFYGEEGFFENNSPNSNDKKNVILFSNEKTSSNNGIIKEILHIKNKNYHSIIAKVFPEEHINDKLIRMLTTFKDEKGNVQTSYIDLHYDKFHSIKTQLNFVQNIRPIEILQINNIFILDK